MSKRTFKIANPWHKPGDYLSTLLRFTYSDGQHLGLGGLEPHWCLTMEVGRGAGLPWGCTLYLARECKQPKTIPHHPWCQLMDLSHERCGCNDIRLVWQWGITRQHELVPHADYPRRKV